MKPAKRGAALAIVGGLAMLGVAGAVMVFGSPFGPRTKPQPSPEQRPNGPPRGADDKVPPVVVGSVSGYAPSVRIETGPVNYDYIGPGWAYVGIKKDWV